MGRVWCSGLPFLRCGQSRAYRAGWVGCHRGSLAMGSAGSDAALLRICGGLPGVPARLLPTRREPRMGRLGGDIRSSGVAQSASARVLHRVLPRHEAACNHQLGCDNSYLRRRYRRQAAGQPLQSHHRRWRHRGAHVGHPVHHRPLHRFVAKPEAPRVRSGWPGLACCRSVFLGFRAFGVGVLWFLALVASRLGFGRV
ncbi:unnamed protein product [Symbiodinium sp. CCMP2592]|nr:unnamed protein product [Symbiodinium sp. CCMP2592]